MSLPKAVVELVLERSNGFCEIGGERILEGAFHHRQKRSQGGKDIASNLIYSCHFHHNLGKPSAHLTVALAYKNGWLVRRNEIPSEIGFLLHFAKKVLLLDDGSCTLVTQVLR